LGNREHTGNFWLAECLARQGRHDEARQVFDLTVSTFNHLGLFPEEYDVRSGEMPDNFSQGLSHLSHIAAAVALGGIVPSRFTSRSRLLTN